MRQAHDDALMALAFAEAEAAAAAGEVPVGAVLVNEAGDVLATGRNRREERGDPTAHAELEALRTAFAGGGWRRQRTTLYVTLEPCPMCMGALLQSRVSRLVFGALDVKAGAALSLYRMAEDPRLNHRMEVVGGVRGEQCSEQLRSFFKELRKAKKTSAER
ncbi:MAG: nucleoside deaminase [Proteobacteria bacterium]|nr:nucleoside deaminase [Pseudomonadota bacterium]